MEKLHDEEVKTINGRDLAALLNIHPDKYRVIYPRINDNINNHLNGKKHEAYCPCKDFGICKVTCNGILTVMDALSIDRRYDIPEVLMPVTFGRYKTGEVWIDDCFDMAYLYIGKAIEQEDVVLNLGGDTCNGGKIQRGYIGDRAENEIFFTRRIFP